jgi:predicted dehydrogenase
VSPKQFEEKALTQERPVGPVRVGVIGVHPNRGWASVSHLPALAALDGIEAVAVASTRADGAAEVARQFDVPLSYGDPYALIDHPDVDVVAVTVKTPDHEPLVRAALDAGKHVFCEWPLGVDAEQSRALAKVADLAGVHHLIGLQALYSPGARFVRELVERGEVGDLTAISLEALTPTLYGAEIVSSMAYTLDRRNGTHLLTTPTGHTLAAVSAAVGDLADVTATAASLHPQVLLTDTGERVPSDAPSEVAFSGRLRRGGVASVAIHGGTPVGAPRLSMSVIGTRGALVVGLTRPQDSINVGDWTVAIARGGGSLTELEVPVDPRLPRGLPVGPARNVALMYAELADAIGTGRPAVPDFAAAVRFHETLEAIELAAQSGQRQVLAPYSP